ncbi:IS110 family transposase, partial [Burkholderia vietnamiensis]
MPFGGPISLYETVSKGHHHAVALDRNGKRLYNKALPNDEAKLRALIAELKTHGRL